MKEILLDFAALSGELSLGVWAIKRLSERETDEDLMGDMIIMVRSIPDAFPLQALAPTLQPAADAKKIITFLQFTTAFR
jgi:hypothetical protein